MLTLIVWVASTPLLWGRPQTRPRLGETLLAGDNTRELDDTAVYKTENKTENRKPRKFQKIACQKLANGIEVDSTRFSVKRQFCVTSQKTNVVVWRCCDIEISLSVSLRVWVLCCIICHVPGTNSREGPMPCAQRTLSRRQCAAHGEPPGDAPSIGARNNWDILTEPEFSEFPAHVRRPQDLAASRS